MPALIDDEGVAESILQQRKLTTRAKRGKNNPMSEIDTAELFKAIQRQTKKENVRSGDFDGDDYFDQETMRTKHRDEQQRSKALKKRDFFGFLAGHDTQPTDVNLPVRFKEQQFGGFRQPAEIVVAKAEPSSKPKKPIPQEVWMGLMVVAFCVIPAAVAGLLFWLLRL